MQQTQNIYQKVLKVLSILMFLVYATFGSFILAFSHGVIHIILWGLLFVILPVIIVIASWNLKKYPERSALTLIISNIGLVGIFVLFLQGHTPAYIGEITATAIVACVLLFLTMRR